MARTKGMLNLSGNLEVNAQAPLDARTIVPTEADLTVASNFPYPYVGLEVYVTGTGKKFRLTNLDTTQSSSWHEIGEGGGGSGLPSGGTQGQYLVKQSSTEGDADWQMLSDFGGATASTAGAHGLVPAPSAGDEGKVLFGNGAWGALPSVDLSVLSNEAFIFSATEKPVGMWTDRKILYAKSVNCGAGPNNTTKVVSAGISNLDKTVYINGIIMTANPSDPWYKPIPEAGTDDFMYIDYNNGNIRLRTSGDYSNGNCYATLFYTKTTDSPLPSDVKFAGVWYDGSVILEKNIDYGSTISISSNGFTSIGMDATNIKMILYAYGYHTDDARCCPLIAIKDNNLVKCIVARDGSPMDLRYFTVRYTTTS